MPKCKLCRVKCSGRFCSPDHAYQWLSSPEGQKAKDRAAERKAKAKDREAKAKKEEYYRNQLGWQHKRTQTTFNKMRKLEEWLWFRENSLPPSCISCLRPWTDDNGQAWHIGHYYSVGSSPAIRYEQKNSHIQCAVCNNHLSGNHNGTSRTIGYAAGFMHRFGQEEGVKILNWLDENKAKPHKWTCGELEEMRKGFNERIRILQKELG